MESERVMREGLRYNVGQEGQMEGMMPQGRASTGTPERITETLARRGSEVVNATHTVLDKTEGLHARLIGPFDSGAESENPNPQPANAVQATLTYFDDIERILHKIALRLDSLESL